MWWKPILLSAAIPIVAVGLSGIEGGEGDWLAFGAGGRALGLGRAYVALAADATAPYWNPAGLALVDQSEITALHAALYEGGQYDFIGLAVPDTPLGPWGGFASLLTVGGAEYRDAQNAVLPGSFSMMKVAVGVATGHRLFADLTVGATVKMLSRVMDTHASGFVTGDVGVRYTPTWLPGFGLAAAFQHVTWARWGQTDDVLPSRVRIGCALTSPVSMVGVMAAEVETRLGVSGQALVWRVGCEAAPIGPLTPRVGFDGGELAAGLGFSAGGAWRFDYGLARHADLGVSHRVAASVSWGPHLREVQWDRAHDAYEQALELWNRDEGRGVRNEDAKTFQNLLEEVLRLDADNQGAARLLKKLEQGRQQ